MSHTKFNLGCFGNGKSSAFFVSQTPAITKSAVFTEHPAQASQVLSYNGDRIIDLPQLTDINSIRQFIVDGISRRIPTALVVTTNPERGKDWLDKLMSDAEIASMIRSNPSLISFILPQSPNPFLEDFKKTGCPVVQLDYYPGIGGVRYGDDGIARVVAGVKENTNYVIVNSEVLEEEKIDDLRNVIRCLCGNQEIREFRDISQINLPTNAFLHTVGIIVHIAEELAKRGVIDESILGATTSKEFFDKFNEIAGTKTPAEINALLGRSLIGKGFYRQMPRVGPNILMIEMGDAVCQIRRRLIEERKMPHSVLDETGADGAHNASHIANHLKEKYARQYRDKVGVDPYSVSFGEFINNNPPYQNPGIVFPTKEDGSVNVNHRFFTEELPTLKRFQILGSELGIPEEQMKVFSDVIGFCEKLSRTNINVTSSSRLSGVNLRSKL